MKMPFGKFKGEDICDIEISYLKWVEENIANLDPYLRREINHEIERREGDRSSLGLVKPKIKLPEVK